MATGLRSRISTNLWLLKTFKDWSSVRAMKGASGGSGLSELNIRGLDQPVLFRPNTTDVPVVWELFHNAEYECKRWPFRTVVDCGANVGIFMAWLKHRGSIGRYVGVEPDRESFCVLSKQVHAQRMDDRATLLNAAVWEYDGQVAFDDDCPSWGRRVSDSGRARVDAMTLERILDTAELDSCELLKLDIEGGEERVLPQIMRQCGHRVDSLVVELHGTLDYRWFSNTVTPAGFVALPPGALFTAHPGAVRCDSNLAALLLPRAVMQPRSGTAEAHWAGKQ